LNELKKKSYISPEDVENENVNLSLTIWDKLSIEAQEEVNRAVKNMNWQDEEWDLSEGGFLGLSKILEVSLMVNSKSLLTLKLCILFITIVSNGLKDIKLLQKCHFANLTHLYICTF
jgi:hypothetical protein